MNCAYNVLQSNKFVFKIDRIPETSFFVTDVNLPEVLVMPAQAGYIDDSGFVPGSQAEFGNLQIQFTVDDACENYIEVFNWMTSHRFDNRQPQKDTLKDHLSDAFLIVLDNTSNPLLKFKFVDAFPVSLSELQFETDNEPRPVHATVTLKYTHFVLNNSANP